MACRREALPGQHTEQGVPTTVPSYNQVGARSRATFSKVLSSAPGETMVSVNRLLGRTRSREEAVTGWEAPPTAWGTVLWVGHPGLREMERARQALTDISIP